MNRNYSNFAVATSPAIAIGSGDASIDVAANTDYPSPSFVVVVFEGGDTPESASTKETMLVTAESGTGPYTWTVNRDIDGYNGSAQSFTTDATVWHVTDRIDAYSGAHAGIRPLRGGSLKTLIPAAGGTTTSGISAGRIGWTPFPLKVSCTLASISINVTSGGTSPGTIDVRLYRAQDNGLPKGEEVAILGQDSWGADTSGVKTKTHSLDLRPDLYWIGWQHVGWGTVPDIQGVDAWGQNETYLSQNSIKSDFTEGLGLGDLNGYSQSLDVIDPDNNEPLRYMAEFN